MAGATLWLLRRRLACRLAGGKISVAAAATACAPTWPPCVSLTWNSRSANRKARIARAPVRHSARRLPPPKGVNRLSYKVQKACDGMSQSSLSLQKPDRLGLRVIEHRRRQRPAKHGAGIEVQPIAAQIGHAVGQRRMAMHDQAAVVAAMGQERLSDPQQVEIILRLKRRTGIDAGM